MALIVKSSPKYESVPAVKPGLYQAVCYGIIDLGTHMNQTYNKKIHECMILWELVDCKITIEKDGVTQELPRAVSRRYTLSLAENATLRKHVELWSGKQLTQVELAGFDLESLLGLPCQVQIINNESNGRTYANVANIVQAPHGTNIEPTNEFQVYSLKNGKDIPDNIPNWIANIIRNSEEYSRPDKSPQ